MKHVDSANASSYGYDALGRMTTETNLLTPSGQFSYAYLGLTGRVASVTNPNGQSSVYTYQDSTAPNEPRLAEISNLNASSGVISKFDYQYDTMGRITQWSQQADAASPTTWSYGYDPASELTSAVQKDSSGNTLNVDSYGYDNAGNRLSAQTNGTVVSQTPNSVNQLGATSVGGSLLWQGHANKPLYSVTVNSKPTTISNSTNFVGTVPVTSGTNTVSVVAEDTKANVSTNNFQTLVAGTGASAPTYDADGNLTTDAQGNTYQWDERNQLIAIVYNAGSNSGNHTEFTYNAIGQRLKIVERSGATVGSGTITSTKQFVWDQTQMAEEWDASNAVTKRFYAQGEQISGTSYYYTRDHLGSVREMVDGSGTIQARYSYDPYGNATKVSGTLDSDFQYAGYYVHQYSGLNLTLFRAYNPSTATWLSRDPSEKSGVINCYSYAAGLPTTYYDPLGLTPLPAFDSPDASGPEAVFELADEGLSNEAAIQNAIDSTVDSVTAKADTYAGILDDSHLEAAARELDGEVVATKADGTPFDHVQEVRDAEQGVTNQIAKVQRAIAKGYDAGADVSKLLKLLSRLSKMLDKAKGACPIH